MEKGLKESSDKFLRDVIKMYLEEADRQIAEDKLGRKQKGLVVERRNEERTVYTRFGRQATPDRLPPGEGGGSGAAPPMKNLKL